MPSHNPYKNYSKLESVRLIASLQLIPELHGQTLVIEQLTDELWRSAKGAKTPDQKDLKGWLKSVKGSDVERAQDPPEDAYLGRLTRPFDSDVTVFLGRVSHADRTLEDLLVAMLNSSNVGSDHPLFIKTSALVMLASSIAEKLGLKAQESTVLQSKLKVPQWRRIEPAMAALTFSEKDLASFGLVDELLQDLLADEPGSKLEGEYGAGRQLVRRPLLANGNGEFVYTLPCRCRDTILSLIVDSLSEHLDEFWSQVSVLQCERLLSNSGRLGIAPRNPRGAPTFEGLVRAEWGMIDADTAVHLVGLPGYFPDPVDCPHSSIARAPEGLDEYLCEFRAWIIDKKIDRVFTIVVFCGMPSGFSLGVQKPPKGCFYTALPVYDVNLIADSTDGLLHLMQSVEHQNDLQALGVTLMNWAGIVNFHAYRINEGSDLYPMGDSDSLRRMMFLEPTFARDWRIEQRNSTDRRVLIHPFQKVVELVRWKAGSRRPTETSQRIYKTEPPPIYSKDEIFFRILCEGEHGLLWFSMSSQDSSPEYLEQVFNMAVGWLGAAWCTLPGAGGFGQLEIDIVFDPEIEDLWKVEKADGSDLTIYVSISEAGLKKFHAPDNKPEKEFIGKILDALDGVIPEKSVAGLRANVNKRQRDPNARYIHQVYARDATVWVQGDVAQNAYWPASRTRMLYRWRIIVRDLNLAGFQSNAENYREALDGLVEQIWTSIEKELKGYSLPEFVELCMRSLTRARADTIHLDLTTGALLAVHPEEDGERNRLHEWRYGLQAAPRALRFLVETAVCHCKDQGARIGNDRLMALMSKADLLLELSQVRFGVFQGHINPEVYFDHEGNLKYEAGEIAALMDAYSQATYNEWDTCNVSSYANQIGALELGENEDPPQANLEFEAAYQAEFGISIKDLDKVISCLENESVSDGKCSAVLSLNAEEIAALSGLDQETADAFVEAFTLPIRSGRYEDIDLPRGEQEVHPWLDRRQLSLLSKPMVPDSRKGGSRRLIPVGLLRQGIILRVNQWAKGMIPSSAAVSEPMQKHLGTARKDWGLSFELAIVGYLEAAGYTCLQGRDMRFYGAPKDPNLGDLDILAWHPAKDAVLALECKNLIQPKGLADVIGSLKSFSGKSEKDSLTKHLKRVDWLRENWTSVLLKAGINGEAKSLESILLFNAPSPVGLGQNEVLVETRTQVFHTKAFLNEFCIGHHDALHDYSSEKKMGTD